MILENNSMNSHKYCAIFFIPNTYKYLYILRHFKLILLHIIIYKFIFIEGMICQIKTTQHASIIINFFYNIHYHRF